MPSTPSKKRVREAFDRAAITYDGAAIVQRRIVDRLLEALPLDTPAPQHILDAGCGTGYAARRLRQYWPAARITGVDFAPAMLNHARHETDLCLAADIEDLPCANAQIDLWWSSLSIQWCRSEAVFREAARVLKPGGHLALSTLGPDTFHELRSAFASVDTYRHTLHFSSPEEISSALEQAGFANLCLQRETQTVHYPDLKSLLHSVKAIGAHNIGNGARNGMMGRQSWQALEAAYEKHRQAQGLPASYDVLLCYASNEKAPHRDRRNAHARDQHI